MARASNPFISDARGSLDAFYWRVRVVVAVLSVLLSAGTHSVVVFAARNPSTSHSHSGNIPQANQLDVTIELKQGETLTRQIAGGETQILTISMLTGQYAVVNFEWSGLDLDVTVLKPKGDRIVKPGDRRIFGSDIQVRGSGSLPISIVAEVDGNYELEVRPSEKLKISGNYTATLTLIHQALGNDENRFKGQRLLAEGEQAKTNEGASEKFRQALALWQEPDDSDYEAYTLRLLASKYISGSEPAPKAFGDRGPQDVRYYESAIAKRQHDAPRKFAYFLMEIGGDYLHFGSRDSALEYYWRALQIFREAGEQRGEASALYQIGFTHAKTGALREAISYYEQALTIQRSERNRLGEARTLNAVGGAHKDLGNQQEALLFFELAQPIWLELGDTYRAAITEFNIGGIYHNWGDLQDASNNYTRALSVFQARLKPDPNQPAIDCRTPTTSFVRLCSFIADVKTNLGELYNSLGDTKTAHEQIDEAISIREALKEPEGLGFTLSSKAYSLLLDRKPAEALKFCDQALPFSDLARDRRRSGFTLTFKGMAYAALNQPEKALEFYKKALQIQEEIGERRSQAITLDKMGAAYALEANPNKASDCLNQALRIWQEVGDQDGQTITHYNIARVEQNRGDLAAARVQVDKALGIVESKRIGLTSKTMRTTYFANKENYYELDIDLKMHMTSLAGPDASVIEALESSEKARGRTLLDTIGDSGIGREAPTDPTNSSDQELVELVKRKEDTERKLQAMAYERIGLRSGPSDQERLVAIEKGIISLEEQYDEIETAIRKRSPRYAALVKPVPLTAKAIQQQLDDKTLLLEYSLGDRRSYVWAVTPDAVKGVELKGRKEIEDAAARMNKALIDRNQGGVNDTPQQIELHRNKAEAEYSKAAAELSKLVIQPVATLLGNKRLVIVADGTLQLVSFGALPDPNGANASGERTTPATTPKKTGTTNDPKPLLENHEIVYEASASVLALQRKEFGSRQPARHALAVLADPVFDQEGFKLELEKRRAAKAREGKPQPGPDSSGSSREASARSRSDLTRAIDDMGISAISPLPESRDEAEAIMKVVPKGEGMSALGFDASRATVMSPGLSQYRIIHFATHGFADLNHPELSGIVLSLLDAKGQSQDGYLRLHDIYNLNLPADLVVLSACQTGVGKQIRGEGLIALTRGFTYAGAASVVASLWKVDDEATKILMEEFYKQMFTNGLKPAAALQKAQLKLAHQGQWRSPFYWAGFVLQGEWK
jgi:CHAT domain-containing protein